MTTPTRIIGFVVGLALVFGAAFGVARVFFDDSSRTSAGPYTLRLASSSVDPGSRVRLSFTILDADKNAVTRFDVRHDKLLHLIVVTKDFSQFRHVHPVMAADGTWSVEAPLVAGAWRVFADFQPHGGQNDVVHADLTVRGPATVAPDTTVRQRSSVDGYTVTAIGDLTAGTAGSMLDLDIADAHGPVTDLQPYLGSYGHLVVLRDTDMQYLHVHPEAGPPGPRIPFHVVVPTPGIYHLYLDFKSDGVVRTASFVLRVKAAAPGAAQPTTDMSDMAGMDDGDH